MPRKPPHRVARLVGPLTMVALVLGGSPSAPAHSGTPAADARALHAQLRDLALEHVGETRDAAFQHDRLRFHVERAQLYLTPPVEGLRTGAVLLGDGRVRMEPPNRVEAHQLEKYLDESTLDQEFETMVMRFSGSQADELMALARPGGQANLRDAARQYGERHKKLLEDQLVDLDARILADLLSPPPDGETYFAADIDADNWITVISDPRNMEEIRVYQSHGGDRQPNVWSSFHLQRDYVGGGRPSARLGSLRHREHWQPEFDMPDIATDVAVDDGDNIEGLATLRLTALQPTGIARLDISPVLEILEVRWSPDSASWPPSTVSLDPRVVPDLPGEPLAFIQGHVGRGMREDLYVPDVLVALAQPLRAGDSIRLHVRYRGDMIAEVGQRNYAVRDPMRWYPRHPHARRTRFVTTFRAPDNRDVASGGVLVSEEVLDGTRVITRRVDTPTIGMAFLYGRLDPYTHEADGEPPITVYASRDSTAFNPGRRDDTIEDLRRARTFFAQYFGAPPFEELTIAESPASGAWAFHGFLLMPSSSFGGMVTGEAELFRSHELAHQWWGNSVTWDSYHDQWLSEGFAQYAAALYAQQALQDDKQFAEMMAAWRKDVMGRGDIGRRIGTRDYGFSPEFLRKSEGSGSGPVWIGYRLSSDKTPPDYRVLVYEKGAFILHMLRMLTYDWDSGSDEPFRQLMRTFHARHAGSHATTEDFLDVAEETYGQDLIWFFDQWVYGTEIPEYRADLEGRQSGTEWRLQGTIRQSDVSHDFRMPLPVRVHLRDGTTQVIVVPVAGTGAEVDEPLRGPVDRIEVNPLEAVLANVR